jgi:hypothetical protein
VKNIEIDNSYVTCNVTGSITGTVNLKITKIGDLVTVKILNAVSAPVSNPAAHYIGIVDTDNPLTGPLLPYIRNIPNFSFLRNSALVLNNIVIFSGVFTPGNAIVPSTGVINFSLPDALNGVFTGTSGIPPQSISFLL